jgi:hypothetical protein
MNNPNRFTKETIATLAKRAGYICSNPYCRANTVGPHSEESRAVVLGEAAHIRGAEPGSARHDLSMTPAERKNIVNGIWLCRKCARLIDADEMKYTVEVLYNWKRLHEEEMEVKLTETGWQRKVEEFNLRLFESESPAAQQIIIDKPETWEYMLTAEMLRARLRSIMREYSELTRGLIYRPSSLLDGSKFANWLQRKLSDIEAIIRLLKIATCEELVTAWGKPGTPGDAIEIKRAVEKIAFGCNSLLEWEIDLHFTRFPDDFDNVKMKMHGWTEHVVTEIERIPKEIAHLLELSERPREYSILLTFTFPANISEVIEDVRKIMRRNSA